MDNGYKQKVLAVEDNVDLSFGIKFSLGKEDMTVDTAGSLEEARCLLQKNKYNLIILDILLPDGKGFELCESIRKTSDIPVIFLTACDEEMDIVRGLDMGGDDYITKPFKLQEFISRVKAVMRRYSKNVEKTAAVLKYGKSENLISGDITLDRLQGIVYKRGQQIALTPLEFRLAYIFMNNPMILLTRDKILEMLWDSHGEYVEDKTLTVHISRLREKVEDFQSKPCYIVTVRGMGYKWNAAVEKE
jgi:DNA-binding response OmpR family regulator